VYLFSARMTCLVSVQNVRGSNPGIVYPNRIFYVFLCVSSKHSDIILQ
jgi:hypothetical protein